MKTKYFVRARCDFEDYFCVDSFTYELETSSIAEAAKYIEEVLSRYTVIEIRKDV